MKNYILEYYFIQSTTCKVSSLDHGWSKKELENDDYK